MYKMLKICKKHEIPIIVNSDGHYCDLVGRVSEAEKMIKEIGYPEELIANKHVENIYRRISSKRPDFAVR